MCAICNKFRHFYVCEKILEGELYILEEGGWDDDGPTYKKWDSAIFPDTQQGNGKMNKIGKKQFNSKI